MNNPPKSLSGDTVKPKEKGNVQKNPELSVSGFVFVSAEGSWKGWVMLCGGFISLSLVR
jgi:hypothetical protein